MNYPRDFNESLRNKPICGVLAVAICAGTTFERATAVIKDNMMPHQKRHGGKTFDEQIDNSLRDLGKRFYKIASWDQKERGRPTLRRAIEEYCVNGRTYMITTSRHVVTVRDGVVVDQTIMAPIAKHPAKRQFVVRIVEIY
jgi:hypothetical protein